MAVQRASKGFQDERYRKLIASLVNQRQRLGLSQEALGVKLGRHQQFVSRYETGERRLDAVEFTDIARTLGLDPTTLVGGVASVHD